ncbi:MAG: hypothetical protein RLZZ303_1079, partial [Candidatus Hydrogenedentota bacterium]
MSSGTPKAIIGVQDLVHSYGNQPVLDGISLTVHEGDRIGLIGRNGCGKSTLMKILTGAITPDHGTVSLRQGVRVALLAQQNTFLEGSTVGSVLDEAARAARACLETYHGVMDRLAHSAPGSPEHAALEEEAGRLHHRLDIMSAWDLDHEVKRIEVALALPPQD